MSDEQKNWAAGLESLARVIDNEGWPCSSQMVIDAGKEIERLIAEGNELRAYLQEIRDHHEDSHFEEWAREFAGQALKLVSGMDEPLPPTLSDDLCAIRDAADGRE